LRTTKVKKIYKTNKIIAYNKRQNSAEIYTQWYSSSKMFYRKTTLTTYLRRPIWDWGRCYDHRRFLPIFGKKLAFFLEKDNVMIQFLHKLGSSNLGQDGIFWPNVWANIILKS
jgi:hypothetical protein